MTTSRCIRAALLLMVAGCRQAPPPAPIPAPAPIVLPPSPVLSEWPATLADALRAAESGDFDGADRRLLDFGMRNAGKPEGIESDFWRALIKADPLNAAPTNRERMALFDAYLAAGTSAPTTLSGMRT